MKILLAIDDSTGSRTALAEVRSRNWPQNSEVIIITAYEIELGPMGKPWLIPHDEARISEAIQKQANQLVDEAAKKLRSHNKSLKVTTRTVRGSPSRVIVEASKRYRVDLIVLGSHGHGRWERLLLGSVAHAVALHANCSVEIVRRKRHRST